jgi:hypothetical protein
MKLATIIKLLALVAPASGVDTAKLKLVIAILELLTEDEEEKKT